MSVWFHYLAMTSASQSFLFLKGGIFRERHSFAYPWPASKPVRKRIIAMDPFTFHHIEIKSEITRRENHQNICLGNHEKGPWNEKMQNIRRKQHTPKSYTYHSIDTLSFFPKTKNGRFNCNKEVDFARWKLKGHAYRYTTTTAEKKRIVVNSW